MSYNNFNTFGTYNNPYLNQYRAPIQPQSYVQPAQPMAQPITQPLNAADLPFSLMRFLNEAEATTYVMDLNSKGMFIDRNNKICVVKWCDAYGNSECKKYRFEEMDNSVEQKPKINLEDFVKRTETTDFVTKNEMNDFVKKHDLNQIFEQINSLERQLKNNRNMENNRSMEIKNANTK